MADCLEKTCNKLIVLFVWLLIFGIGIGFCGLYLPELYLKNKVYFFILTIVFAIVFSLLVVSYARVTCTDPGSPDGQLTMKYSKEGRLQQLKQYTAQRKLIQKQRQKKQFRNGSLQQHEIIEQINAMKSDQYCKKCNIVRPPRCHHCSVCDMCVLRMDHHCPWTGNCIGLRNHKYFILFLAYATLGLGIVSFNILIDWIIGKKVVGDVQDQFNIYAYPIIGIASLLLMLAIGFLFITQMIGALSNLTTLQSFVDSVQDHVMYFINKVPFDKGSSSLNLKDIFGKQGSALLPTKPIFQPSINSGISKSF